MTAKIENLQARRAARRACPICRRKAEPDWRPFCSRRCADLDLARWLDGAYRIPDDEPPATEPEEP